jgi:DNA-binding LytR/AlgR family response regulator
MMSGKVKIRIDINPSCREPEVIIRTSENTSFIDNLINTIERYAEGEYSPVAAYKKGTLVLLDQWEIWRIYTESRKVMIRAESGEYESRQPLRDLEEMLDQDCFVRISRFEIVNLRRVSAFDFSQSGTIRVIFEDGSETWVARRYVQAIQQTLKKTEAKKEGERNV